eukprot:358287-Chlamydomonas_euryale.AAC.3
MLLFHAMQHTATFMQLIMCMWMASTRSHARAPSASPGVRRIPPGRLTDSSARCGARRLSSVSRRTDRRGGSLKGAV